MRSGHPPRVVADDDESRSAVRRVNLSFRLGGGAWRAAHRPPTILAASVGAQRESRELALLTRSRRQRRSLRETVQRNAGGEATHGFIKQVYLRRLNSQASIGSTESAAENGPTQSMAVAYLLRVQGTPTLRLLKWSTIIENDAMPVHPGEILKDELRARGLSGNGLALALRVPAGPINHILTGRRGISTETALRLGRHFGNERRFWLNLQVLYDLEIAEPSSRRARSNRT